MNKFARISKFSQRAALAAVLAALLLSHAAIDTAVATGGISDAQTAIVTVLGAMITMAAAIFGLYKVYGLINRKG